MYRTVNDDDNNGDNDNNENGLEGAREVALSAALLQMFDLGWKVGTYEQIAIYEEGSKEKAITRLAELLQERNTLLQKMIEDLSNR